MAVATWAREVEHEYGNGHADLPIPVVVAEVLKKEAKVPNLKKHWKHEQHLVIGLPTLLEDQVQLLVHFLV